MAQPLAFGPTRAPEHGRRGSAAYNIAKAAAGIRLVDGNVLTITAGTAEFMSWYAHMNTHGIAFNIGMIYHDITSHIAAALTVYFATRGRRWSHEATNIIRTARARMYPLEGGAPPSGNDLAIVVQFLREFGALVDETQVQDGYAQDEPRIRAYTPEHEEDPTLPIAYATPAPHYIAAAGEVTIALPREPPRAAAILPPQGAAGHQDSSQRGPPRTTTWWQRLHAQSREALHHVVHPSAESGALYEACIRADLVVESLARRLDQIGYAAFPILLRAYYAMRPGIDEERARAITTIIVSAVARKGLKGSGAAYRRGIALSRRTLHGPAGEQRQNLDTTIALLLSETGRRIRAAEDAVTAQPQLDVHDPADDHRPSAGLARLLQDRADSLTLRVSRLLTEREHAVTLDQLRMRRYHEESRRRQNEFEEWKHRLRAA